MEQRLESIQYAGQEMLSDRFQWLVKYDGTHRMRLLAEVLASNNYTDVTTFIADDPSRRDEIAGLFGIPSELLFGITYYTENEFMRLVEDYRAGKSLE